MTATWVALGFFGLVVIAIRVLDALETHQARARSAREAEMTRRVNAIIAPSSETLDAALQIVINHLEAEPRNTEVEVHWAPEGDSIYETHPNPRYEVAQAYLPLARRHLSSAAKQPAFKKTPPAIDRHLLTCAILAVSMFAAAHAQRAPAPSPSPLEAAVRANDVGAAELALDAGATVNEIGASGDTPVIGAISHGPLGLPMLRMLLARGADPNIKSKDGEPPLIRRPCIAAGIALLLEYGADPEATDYRGETVLHHLAGLSFDPCGESLALVLAGGANVNARDGDGRTPLSHASNVAAVQTLIEYGSGLEVRDKRGITPLGWLTLQGDFRPALYLIAAGADVNSRDGRGISPASWLASHNPAGRRLFAEEQRRRQQDEAAMRKLIAVATDTARPPSERTVACHDIPRAGIAKRLAIPGLIGMLHDRSPAVVAAAAGALGRIGRPAADAVPELIKLVHPDQPFDVRSGSVSALAFFGAAGRAALKAALAALAEDLASRDALLHEDAALLIANAAGATLVDAFERRILPTVDAPEFELRVTAPVTQDSVAAIVNHGRNTLDIVRRAMRELPMPASVVPALIKDLSDPRPPIRRAAYLTLGALGPLAIESLPALEKAAAKEIDNQMKYRGDRAVNSVKPYAD
jgi:ankyrin repeat protein